MNCYRGALVTWRTYTDQQKPTQPLQKQQSRPFQADCSPRNRNRAAGVLGATWKASGLIRTLVTAFRLESAIDSCRILREFRERPNRTRRKVAPQFGQRPCNLLSVQSRQNVHSKLQIMASVESGGKSLLQHSQLGRSSSILSEILPYRSLSKAKTEGASWESASGDQLDGHWEVIHWDVFRPSVEVNLPAGCSRVTRDLEVTRARLQRPAN